jgi:hypothetical protein
MPKGSINLLASLHSGRMDWPVAVHSARTAVAVVVSEALLLATVWPEEESAASTNQ